MKKFIAIILLPLAFLSCNEKTDLESPEREVQAEETPLEWTKNANIYEVNLRQYSEAGTFDEFAKHLPRLKEMGVDILWLMPIQPIGELNRKGSLGSYYSIKDYVGVNPEHGTLEDFKNLVAQIHEMEMHVLIDWVANHTSWDNDLTRSHPEWYSKDASGNFAPPVPDWSDVIDLNYDEKGLWDYMINSMKFWVETADIDGFRCDVAEMVPLEFWQKAKWELDKLKQVFMLAEGENPNLHEEAFQATYSWEFHHLMNSIARKEKNARDIFSYFENQKTKFKPEAYRLQFTSNHDENSWNGTVEERMGNGAKTFAVLSTTVPGIPLIYSGQEAGLNKRLAFFDKDVINWTNLEMANFYQALLELKRQNPALWNGKHGGDLTEVEIDKNEAVCAFTRKKNDNKILVVLNLSEMPQNAKLKGQHFFGNYSELFSQSRVRFGLDANVALEPWEYRVYVEI